jgi:undecaprenyl-phosphate galactose phosphotransferase
MQNSSKAETLDHARRSPDNDRTTYRGTRVWPGVKRGIDAVLTAVMLSVASPVMIVLWALVKLDGGPGFYGHVRIGRNGREFRCLKFRSMVVDADAVLKRHLTKNPAAQIEWDATQKLARDPRVTWIGRLLRESSLDELPQLFNVLVGDMSLVGPRPVVRAELTRFYGPEDQQAYLSIRPGVTGLWQVSGRSDVAYARRVALDTEYVRSASLSLDVNILWRTIGVVLLRKGAR